MFYFSDTDPIGASAGCAQGPEDAEGTFTPGWLVTVETTAHHKT